MATTSYFTSATFSFLGDLAANNNREWFSANRERYERDVRDPALRFITEIAEPLGEIAPHFPATPKSLFRIHRDTRFSPDKRPYKTFAGIHFRHHAARNPHVPVFYLHLQPGQSFVAVGAWHPDSPTLGAIRDRIVDEPGEWRTATQAPEFTSVLSLQGDSLKRAPKGYDADHPLLEDLRRKDFVAVREMSDEFVTGPDLPRRVTEIWRAGVPFMRFLCAATDTPFDP